MLSHLNDQLIALVTQFYHSTSLVGIAIAMALESCCIPLPSEVVMPVAGILIANGTLLKGEPVWLSLFLVSLAGAIGCLLGSITAYGIGLRGGRTLLLKYGKYVLISAHEAEKADKFFARWGSLTVFFTRMLPGIRTYISLPAGITRMPFGKFCLYSFIGSFPWCLLLAYLGYLLGNNIAALSPYFHIGEAVLAVLLIILVLWYIYRQLRARREQGAIE
ncbi:alkaline phosphatase [Ktedonobacteria bacterium brp13]|nr:alkaline phosphatase [Ktedonobacteria bacterium brp13]